MHSPHHPQKLQIQRFPANWATRWDCTIENHTFQHVKHWSTLQYQPCSQNCGRYAWPVLENKEGIRSPLSKEVTPLSLLAKREAYAKPACPWSLPRLPGMAVVRSWPELDDGKPVRTCGRTPPALSVPSLVDFSLLLENASCAAGRLD